MYPPRSAKYKKEKKQKQQRQSRAWLVINLSLIVLVCLFGLYFYYNSMNVRSATGTGHMPSKIVPHIPASPAERIAPEASSSEHSDAGVSSSNSPGNGEPNGGARVTTVSGLAMDPSNSVLLHFGGDTLFSGKVEQLLGSKGFDYPFQYVTSLFQQDDLTLVNLETPVTKRGTSAKDKQFVFKSPPEALHAMKQAGVDVVNLANNHTLDQGPVGLLDTLDYLKTVELGAVGAGENADQAYRPYYVDRKGIRIAVFGFSRVLPSGDWIAGPSKLGIAGVYDPTRAYAAIQSARSQADLIIVVAHWGTERVQQQNDTQTSLAHGFIDAGADLIVGGHPHVLQGLEQYKGKWIAYSTGNFIFTKSTNAKTWETAVFEARCTKQSVCSMKLIPYDAELGQPVPMIPEDGANLLKEIGRLSPGLTVDSSGNVLAKKKGTAKQ